MFRDLRAWHGATPNVGKEIRAMPNVEYGSSWLDDRYFSRCMPHAVWETLSDHAKALSPADRDGAGGVAGGGGDHASAGAGAGAGEREGGGGREIDTSLDSSRPPHCPTPPDRPMLKQKFTAKRIGRAVAIAFMTTALAVSARAETILFVGNSFTFAALSPVWHYRSAGVTDLNGEGVGGVPALFKVFAGEAGLPYDVSLETSPGKDLQWHIDNRTPVIDRAYDHVILQSYSTLDARNPGDPDALIQSVAALARMFHGRNPNVDIRLDATWSRADLTYQPGGHWYGKPIAAMERDVSAGYRKAAAASPWVHDVIEVGAAWNRAHRDRFRDRQPLSGHTVRQGRSLGLRQLSRQRLRLLYRGADDLRRGHRQRPPHPRPRRDRCAGTRDFTGAGGGDGDDRFR